MLVSTLPAQKRSANFTGTESYLRVDHSTSLKMYDAMTFACWVYPSDEIFRKNATIMAKEGEYELAIFPKGELKFAFANYRPGWKWTTTEVFIPYDQWTHIAITYKLGLIRTYINGELRNTYSGAGYIRDIDMKLNEFWIGNRQGKLTHSHWNTAYEGLMDEVALWNRDLSKEEIQKIWNYPVDPNAHGLLAYYNFDGKMKDKLLVNDKASSGGAQKAYLARFNGGEKRISFEKKNLPPLISKKALVLPIERFEYGVSSVDGTLLKSNKGGYGKDLARLPFGTKCLSTIKPGQRLYFGQLMDVIVKLEDGSELEGFVYNQHLTKWKEIEKQLAIEKDLAAGKVVHITETQDEAVEVEEIAAVQDLSEMDTFETVEDDGVIEELADAPVRVEAEEDQADMMLNDDGTVEVLELSDAPSIGFEDVAVQEVSEDPPMPLEELDEVPDLGVMDPDHEVKSSTMAQENTIPTADEIIPVSVYPIEQNHNKIQKRIGYPQKAREYKLKGHVPLRVLIDKEGRYVRHIRKGRSNNILYEAVEEHIQDLRWSPAMHNGKAIYFWVNVNFYVGY